MNANDAAARVDAAARFIADELRALLASASPAYGELSASEALLARLKALNLVALDIIDELAMVKPDWAPIPIPTVWRRNEPLTAEQTLARGLDDDGA